MYSEMILENIFFYFIWEGGGVPLLLVFVFVYYILFATAQFNNLVPVVLI